MRTLSDSELAVAVYPTFTYNSVGGGGVATATQEGSIVHMTFDPSTLNIPDVNYRNTTFMGVPMAPPFSIAVKPKKLEVRPCPLLAHAAVPHPSHEQMIKRDCLQRRVHQAACHAGLH
jgi:hypothetical protein